MSCYRNLTSVHLVALLSRVSLLDLANKKRRYPAEFQVNHAYFFQYKHVANIVQDTLILKKKSSLFICIFIWQSMALRILCLHLYLTPASKHIPALFSRLGTLDSKVAKSMSSLHTEAGIYHVGPGIPPPLERPRVCTRPAKGAWEEQ